MANVKMRTKTTFAPYPGYYGTYWLSGVSVNNVSDKYASV